MFKLSSDRSALGKETRAVVVDALLDEMNRDKRVVAMDADLCSASGFSKLEKAHPDRFVQCGISEANMAGLAAGLSAEGMVPFIHSFAPFVTRRCLDQLYMSGAYAGCTVNIYASDPGYFVGPNGGTHTSWEAAALIRLIPGSIVCDAADAVQMDWIVREFIKLEDSDRPGSAAANGIPAGLKAEWGKTGVHVVLGDRKAMRKLYEEGSSFELGRGNLLKQGSEILIVASGPMVNEALDAAERLEAEGHSTAVIDMFCIKPLDRDLIIKEAAGKKLVVTAENANCIGGLGSAVAEVMADEGMGIPLLRHGVDERFGQVGTPAFLREEYGMTSEALLKEILDKLQ